MKSFIVMFFQTTTTGALVEELKRLSAENKKLTEMLTVVCENYNALRRHVEYMRNNPENNNPKSCQNNNNDGNIYSNPLMAANGSSESSSTDEDSPSKPTREEKITAKISRICVRTEPSDTSLVRNPLSMNHPLVFTTAAFSYFFHSAVCEGWISMEKIWTEGD